MTLNKYTQERKGKRKGRKEKDIIHLIISTYDYYFNTAFPSDASTHTAFFSLRGLVLLELDWDRVLLRGLVSRLRGRRVLSRLEGRMATLAICIQRLACTSATRFHPSSVRIHLSPGARQSSPKKGISLQYYTMYAVSHFCLHLYCDWMTYPTMLFSPNRAIYGHYVLYLAQPPQAHASM